MEAGGDRLPAILLTAGSHADEVAGIFSALRLAQELKTDHRVVIMPLRDPLGWRGFRASLEDALDSNLTITSHDTVAAILRSGDVLWEETDFILAQIGELVFASTPAVGWHSSNLARRRIPRLVLEHPEVRTRLAGRRIIMPGNVGYQEDRNPYDWGGHTAYVGVSGYAAQFNRFFDRDDAPIEVTVPRSLATELRPGLTIDLHEGFSNRYYVFATTEASRDLCTAMIAGVRAVGGPIASFGDLAPSWGESVSNITDLGDGVFLLAEPGTTSAATFAGFCAQYGPSLTTEPGMEASVAQRVDWIVAGVQETIRRWEPTNAQKAKTERKDS
jgi:hypothetical protein